MKPKETPPFPGRTQQEHRRKDEGLTPDPGSAEEKETPELTALGAFMLEAEHRAGRFSRIRERFKAVFSDAKQLVYEDFLEYADSLELTEDERVQMNESLRNPEIRRVLELYLEHNVVFLIVRVELMWALGFAIGGNPLFGELARMIAKNAYAVWRSHGLPAGERLKLGALAMWPFVGVHLIPVYLYKKHPLFSQKLGGYLKTGRFAPLIAKIGWEFEEVVCSETGGVHILFRKKPEK